MWWSSQKTRIYKTSMYYHSHSKVIIPLSSLLASCNKLSKADDYFWTIVSSLKRSIQDSMQWPNKSETKRTPLELKISGQGQNNISSWQKIANFCFYLDVTGDLRYVTITFQIRFQTWHSKSRLPFIHSWVGTLTFLQTTDPTNAIFLRLNLNT